MIQICRNIQKLKLFTNLLTQFKYQTNFTNITFKNFSTIRDNNKNIQYQKGQKDIKDSSSSSEQQNVKKPVHKHVRREQNQYFNLSEPMFQYNGDKKELQDWFESPKTYTSNYNKNQVENLINSFKSEIKKINEELNDSVQSINIFLKLLVIIRQFQSSHYTFSKMNKLIKLINDSKSEEEVLMNIALEVLKTIRTKQLQNNKQIPLQLILRLTQQSIYKFKFVQIAEECQDLELKKFYINEIITIIYDFHCIKYISNLNHERLHDQIYDKLLNLSEKTLIQPSLSFSISNISMISDIKQLNKLSYQKIKVHNSFMIHSYLQTIIKNVDQIDDYKLVFVIYKLTQIDFNSFGCNMDSFWEQCEKRLLNKFEGFVLKQRKSLLYSLGKSNIVTQYTNSLMKKLFDINKLNNEIFEENFLEYLANIILFGISKQLFNKESAQILMPLISDLMENKRINQKDKLKFISEVCTKFYREGIYDQQFWKYFIKYQNELLSDKSSFFSLIFITKTISVLADEIDNKPLVEHCYKLHERLLQLPNYQQQIQNMIKQSVQVKQNLFEMRFGSYLHQFGRPYSIEKIINDIFSVDFYLEKENIAIEIEGHQHYIKLADGTFIQNPITKFKIKYLQKLGLNVINLGMPNMVVDPLQHISILRVFQQQYYEIMNKKQN